MNLKTTHYSTIFQTLLKTTQYVTKAMNDRIHVVLDRLNETTAPDLTVNDLQMIDYLAQMSTIARASVRPGERLESYKAMIVLIDSMLSDVVHVRAEEVDVLHTMRSLLVSSGGAVHADPKTSPRPGENGSQAPSATRLTDFQLKSLNLLASALEAGEPLIIFTGPDGSGRALVLTKLVPVYEISHVIQASDPSVPNMSVSALNHHLSKIAQEHNRRAGNICRIIIYGAEVLFNQDGVPGGRVVIPSNCQVIVTLDTNHKQSAAIVKDDVKLFGHPASVVDLPRPTRAQLMEMVPSPHTSEILDQLGRLGPMASFNTLKRILHMANWATIQEATAIVAANTTELFTVTHEPPRPSDIMKQIRERVFSQESVMTALSSVLKRNHAGLHPENRMAGCFLFAGPTGTGKTETALSLAKAINVPMLRIDLSEYAMPHTVHRLIGAPPSYIGYNDGAILVDFLKRHPRGVILIDEAEKGALEVTQLFLGMMDSGTFSTPRGDRIDCANHWLIFTSNAGMRDVAPAQTPLGFGRQDVPRATFSQDARAASERGLGQAFAPEFLNRLDHTVFFNPLTPEVSQDVVAKFIKDMTLHLAKRRGIQLTVTPEVITHIAESGFNERDGARALRRQCERLVGEAVAALEPESGSKIVVQMVLGLVEAQILETTPAPENASAGKR